MKFNIKVSWKTCRSLQKGRSELICHYLENNRHRTFSSGAADAKLNTFMILLHAFRT